MTDLNKLRDQQNRETILLAELAGLLHNIGKLDPNFLKDQVSDSANAVTLLQNEGQFIDGYQFKRFAQPSDDLLAKAKGQIAASSKLDPNVLPSVDPGDLGNAQKIAAETFNKFYRGTGTLNSDQKDRLKKLKLKVESEEWLLADYLTLFWDISKNSGGFVYKASSDDYQRIYALAYWLSYPPAKLPLLLTLAHGEMSGSEKYFVEEDERTGSVHYKDVDQEKTTLDNLRIATAFGYERSLDIWQLRAEKSALISSIPTESIAVIRKRDKFVNFAEQKLQKGLGDTQRPINEISLWNYASSIAALFKASVAKSILEEQVADANQMHWRLLGLRLDGLAYRFQTVQVADLIARDRALRNAFNVVQQLLEDEMPLGNVVYRDEHGMFLVVPEIDGLNSADLETQLGQAIVEKLVQADIDDVGLHFSISPDSLRGKQLNLGQAIRGANSALPSKLRPETVADWWTNSTRQLCTVCQLRPQETDLSICRSCLDRRQHRSKTWATQHRAAETIWLDEVADSTGRLALIVGEFDLDDWLNGILVESMALGMDKSTQKPVPKFASFPRVQRIWETTQKFWQEIQTELHQDHDTKHPHRLKDERKRLKLSVGRSPNLRDYRTYELNLGQTFLSVVWDKTTSEFISVDNLTYSAFQLNIPREKRSNPVEAALEVGVWIESRRSAEQFQVLEHMTETNTKISVGRAEIINVDYEDTSYARTIPILSEPRTFMALVPADKALDVTQAIKEKYEREMGKVRNRLPLHLSAVYFQRRTPLRAALDAGRRMLDRKQAAGGKWRVAIKPKKENGPPPDATYLETDTQQFDQYYAVELERLAGEDNLTWYVPAVMGDGATEDNWYPYVFLETNGDDGKVRGRNRAFKGLRPTDNDPEACWLVHAGDLEAGDAVYFTPATFDFEWLDTTGRRFEIAYDEQGRRRGRLSRPYLLDDLAAFEDVWQTIGGDDGLTNNQIYALRDTIRAKREEWQPVQSDCRSHTGSFWLFCRDVLRNAEWELRPGDKIDRLTGWAVSGLLEDVIELRMSIMKQKPNRTEKQEEASSQ